MTGAVISGNKGSGILVQRGSYLEAANNLINANGGNGIEVRDNAGVVFEIGDKTVTEPNRTDATGMNAGWGLSCSVGGAVTGPLGTLSGAQGAKSFDTGYMDYTKCVTPCAT